MPAIAALYNVPSNDAELAQWALVNAAAHRDINRTIYNLTGVTLDEFLLDPFNPNDPGVWLDQHQVMHQQMDTILGIAGYDLLQVDFNNPQELAGWIYIHANEHVQASNILGIG